MNSLWTRGTTVFPSLNHSYEYDISGKDYQINNTTITDCAGCPSHIHFDSTSYTLSFGHLLSGNLRCYQSCSFEIPEHYSNSFNNILPMNTIQSQQDPLINYRVDKAMENIHKTIKNIERQHDYSIPTVPYCYNSIMNNGNRNNITKAAVLLERPANRQNQFRL